MSVDDSANVIKLRLIAALAQDMANKVERKQTWPGDLQAAIDQILNTLGEIKKMSG